MFYILYTKLNIYFHNYKIKILYFYREILYYTFFIYFNILEVFIIYVYGMVARHTSNWTSVDYAKRGIMLNWKLNDKQGIEMDIFEDEKNDLH